MIIFGVLCAAAAIVCLAVSLDSGCPNCSSEICDKCICSSTNTTFTCNTCCNKCPCNNFKHDITQGFSIFFFIVAFFSILVGFFECDS